MALSMLPLLVAASRKSLTLLPDASFDRQPPPNIGRLEFLGPLVGARGKDGDQCNNTAISFVNCMLKCEVCFDGGAFSNGTCLDPTSGKVGKATGDANVTLTLLKAATALSLEFETSLESQDCACESLTSWSEGKDGCVVNTSSCVYLFFQNANASDINAMYRGRAWDSANPLVQGNSRGWMEPSEGLVGDYGSLDADMAAILAMRAANPARACNPGPTPPLILIPGLTSSIIYYKLDNASTPSWAPSSCERDTDGFLQLYPIDTLPSLCWLANLDSAFDAKTNTFKPLREGETTRVGPVGSFEGIPVFVKFQYLFQAIGWETGKTLFGIPYDWRLPSVSQGKFFTNLKHLIEQVYLDNSQQKVTLWAFSFGPTFTLAFMHRMSPAWKDKYINWFVASSPAWGGTPSALLSYVNGAIPVKPTPPIFTREVSRVTPSFMWTFPRQGTDPTVSYTQRDLLMVTPGKNYTAFDMDELLKDIGMESQIPQRQYLAEEIDLAAYAAPGVNTIVTYGFDIPTAQTAHYDQDFQGSDSQFKVAQYDYESGDGLVPLRSSVRGSLWQAEFDAQNKTLLSRGYRKQQHATCLPILPSTDECANDVIRVLLAGNNVIGG